MLFEKFIVGMSFTCENRHMSDGQARKELCTRTSSILSIERDRRLNINNASKEGMEYYMALYQLTCEGGSKQ